MEAFESFVALAMETENLVVSDALKFTVARQTTSGLQTHGYEVDLVGARKDRLVLATVKSFFGSAGVAADHVIGIAPNHTHNKRYMLLNDPLIREVVLQGAAARFGYPVGQIEVRLYVGKFAGAKAGEHEKRIRAWCRQQHVGAGGIQVVDLPQVIGRVHGAAKTKQYRDNPALVTMKLLDAAGMLNIPKPD